ncbi:MAG: type II toxin-antitoxin system HicA family toxin [Verrucomicrobiales bacterium]
MRRKALVRHIATHGCELLREGGRHSIWWKPDNRRKSAVPRHSEIRETIVKKICKDLGVPAP